jgi:acyl CoA:acetate/3-ketoacid CoA transferase alpha subunit
MAELTTLSEAVAGLVHDGDAVALEGFTHRIPFAAGHELLRHGRADLELIRMTPDVLYDQMVGAGAARKLVFSYAGNPGVGSLHRLRDAFRPAAQPVPSPARAVPQRPRRQVLPRGSATRCASASSSTARARRSLRG